MKAEDFLAIVNTLADPLCLLTVHGEVIAANQAACKLLKHDTSTLMGRILQDLVVPEQVEKLKQHLHSWSTSLLAVPATLKLQMIDNETLECHCQGSLVQASTEDTPALILLQSQEKISLTDNTDTLGGQISCKNTLRQGVIFSMVFPATSGQQKLAVG